MMTVGVGVDGRNYSIFNSHGAYRVVITLNDETMFNGFDRGSRIFYKNFILPPVYRYLLLRPGSSRSKSNLILCQSRPYRFEVCGQDLQQTINGLEQGIFISRGFNVKDRDRI
jgi:hypothetical protein